MKNIQEKILLAIKYINENKGSNIYPRYKTITSFLKGNTNSDLYHIYSKYPDVCGTYPSTYKTEVKSYLDELVDLQFLELKENGDYVIKKQADIINTTEDGLVLSTNEKIKVDEIISCVISMNRNFVKNIKKHYIGTVYKDNVFNFVWVSRNKKTGKLEVKIRKSFELESDYFTFELKDKNISSIKSTIKSIVQSKKEIIKDYENRIKTKTDKFDSYNQDKVYKTIELMPHQKAGVELAQKFNNFAFFYDTGTGKTIMSLEIMASKYIENGNKFLVIAPKPLIKVAWLDDAEKFPNMRLLPLSSDINTNEYLELYNKWVDPNHIEHQYKIVRDSEGNILNKLTTLEKNILLEKLNQYAEHYIVNIEKIREAASWKKFMKKYTFDSLIVDESSIIKNYESENAKRIRVISKLMKNVYLLSGKPAPNNEAEYFSQMKIVAPDVFKMSYNEFLNTYFEQKRFKYYPKNKAIRELIADMVSEASLTVSKEDCLNLPEQKVIKVNFKLSKEYKEKYDSVLEKIVTIFVTENNRKTIVSGLGRLALITKLRELTSGFYIDNGVVKDFNSDKLYKFFDVINNRIGADKQVIIWCNFTHERDMLIEEFKKRGANVVTADGQTKDLAENIYKFKKGEAQYLIANMKTLKYGVTLTNCYNSVFFSLSYSFEDYYQACARVHRKSLSQPCFVYVISAIDTIDTIINKCIEEKNDKTVIFERLVKSFSKFNEKITQKRLDDAIETKIDLADELLVVEGE